MCLNSFIMFSQGLFLPQKIFLSLVRCQKKNCEMKPQLVKSWYVNTCINSLRQGLLAKSFYSFYSICHSDVSVWSALEKKIRMLASGSAWICYQINRLKWYTLLVLSRTTSLNRVFTQQHPVWTVLLLCKKKNELF